MKDSQKQNDSVYSGMKQTPQKRKERGGGGYQREHIVNFSLEAEVWP